MIRILHLGEIDATLQVSKSFLNRRKSISREARDDRGWPDSQEGPVIRCLGRIYPGTRSQGRPKSRRSAAALAAPSVAGKRPQIRPRMPWRGGCRSGPRPWCETAHRRLASMSGSRMPWRAHQARSSPVWCKESWCPVHNGTVNSSDTLSPSARGCAKRIWCACAGRRPHTRQGWPATTARAKQLGPYGTAVEQLRLAEFQAVVSSPYCCAGLARRALSLLIRIRRIVGNGRTKPFKCPKPHRPPTQRDYRLERRIIRVALRLTRIESVGIGSCQWCA